MKEIKNSVRIIRFLIVGNMNFVIMALTVWLLMNQLDLNYILTNAAAYLLAQTNNFFWSKYWVFTSDNKKYKHEIPLFLIAFGCAYILQFLTLLLLVEYFEVNEYLAQFLSLFIYGTVNFLMNKKLTFTKREA